RRARRHQRRGERLSRESADRHGASHRQRRSRGAAGGDAEPVGNRPHLRLRAGGNHAARTRAAADRRPSLTRPAMARTDQTPGIRPRPTIGRRLDVISRHAFPASTTVLVMLLTEMPTGIRGQATLLPAVTLACVWFWSVFRPTAMSPPVVFLIGLLLDLLGVGVFILLVAHAVALRCRYWLAPRGFALLWAVFAAVSVVDAALTWLL